MKTHKVQKVGNSYMISIPKSVVKKLNIKKGDKFNFTLKDSSSLTYLTQTKTKPLLFSDKRRQLLEKKINPFLRCYLKNVVSAVEHYAEKKLPTETLVFEAMRNWKNNF